ncbi:MAG: hypothetical protein WCY26_07125 [Thiohalobacteraceae bacterium]|nr:hypothetical protein [Gammaproteobacteria bacterium]
MQRTHLRQLKLAIGILALASGGLALAGDNDRTHHMPAGPDVAFTSHWQVTDAVFDPTTRILTLQHTVPMEDMQSYGEVANLGFAASGLQLQYVEGHYVQVDTDLMAPHYHFTQWLRLP